MSPLPRTTRSCTSPSPTRLIRAEAGYLVAKASDPPSGTTIDPGDTVTYTVTVTPTGQGTTDDVVVTDNLSQVTPYATVTVGNASQGSATLVGDALTWNVGTVSGTTPRTLTYTATVKDGAYGATLRNHVTADGESPPTACEPCETQHPVTPLWTLEKSSDPPSGTTVEPDTDITYTLTVTNRSSLAPLPAGTVVTDDLTRVLAHASFVGLVEGFPGTAVRAGNTLTWTLPAVPASTAVRLRYTVHVDPGAFDVNLLNVATGHGVTGPSSDCPAPAGTRSSAGTCVTSTEHHTKADSGGVSPSHGHRYRYGRRRYDRHRRVARHRRAATPRLVHRGRCPSGDQRPRPRARIAAPPLLTRQSRRRLPNWPLITSTQNDH